MEKDFSKFELTSGLISAGKKLPVATPSVKKNLLPKTSVFNNSVLLGIAVLFFVVLLLAALSGVFTMRVTVRRNRNCWHNCKCIMRA